MEDFILRALLAGTGVALAAGPLGCVVVWRRMAYFGAALSHAALLGVALGLLLEINLSVGILVVSVLLALLLLALEGLRTLASDTLLGILAHTALALGLVAIALVPYQRVDLMSYLFGDVLAVGNTDLFLIYSLSLVTLVVLALIWRHLLALTVSEDLARVEGVPVFRVKLVFVLLMASVIAVGMQVVGVLLVVSLLIIPAAAARRFSTSPESMAVQAAVFGVLSVIAGVYGSLHFDVPTGPSIVVLAAVLFVLVMLIPRRGPKSIV